jgi:hypothetical protein
MKVKNKEELKKRVDDAQKSFNEELDKQELQLCSSVQSKALRKLGFNWKVYNWYNSDGTLSNSIYADDRNAGGYSISAPTVELALKYMRDVKCIYGEVYTHVYYSTYKRDFSINFTDGKKWFKETCEVTFDSYEQAGSALLDEIIKHLKTEKQ